MNTQKKGRLGEDLAVKYLIGKGYQILERNYRMGRLELDIIATKEGILYFFEVKSNYMNGGDSPLYRIDKRKLKHLNLAAQGYMAENNMHKEFELMGLSVLVNLTNRKAQIEVVSCGWN